MDIKFPEITVQLSEMDGNVFSIIGRTCRAMQRGGVSAEDIEAFKEDAKSGDYDHALQTVMKTVETT